MDWYCVYGHVTVGAYFYVKAESPEDAMKRSRGMEPELAPYGWDRDGKDPTYTPVVEDADGEFVPTSAEVEDPPDGAGEEE